MSAQNDAVPERSHNRYAPMPCASGCGKLSCWRITFSFITHNLLSKKTNKLTAFCFFQIGYGRVREDTQGMRNAKRIDEWGRAQVMFALARACASIRNHYRNKKNEHEQDEQLYAALRPPRLYARWRCHPITVGNYAKRTMNQRKDKRVSQPDTSCPERASVCAAA